MRSSSNLQSSGKGQGFAHWLYVWLPVLLGIAVIAIESTTRFGSNYTSAPLRHIVEAVFGHISDPRWETIHHYIRKCGHFTGYGLIGLAWLRAWWLTLPRSRFVPDAGLALLGTALIAGCDEWHQTYLPNRTGTPWDVLLDCTGAFTLLVLVFLFLLAFKPKFLARSL
jgi:VanZ family protein